MRGRQPRVASARSSRRTSSRARTRRLTRASPSSKPARRRARRSRALCAANAMKGSDDDADAGCAAARGAEAPRTARDADSQVPCPNCGEALVGDYCHRCGENHLESRDLSVRHFLDEAAQELTSVEHSKLFHTLLALLVRPGLLTNEWIAGRRRRYLKPLNLFLGVFAVSLFAYSVYRPVSMYDLRNFVAQRSEEHTSELQSLAYLVCRLLLETKNI